MFLPERLGRRPVLRLAAAAVLPGAAACDRGQPRVALEQAYAGPRLPAPSRILVRDFAVSPADVQLDQGVRGRVEQAFSPDSPDAQRLAAARAAASALAEAMVEALRTSPDLPVERQPLGAPLGAPLGTTPMPGRSAVVEGRLLAVDEGNRTQRVLIGLGRGESRMEAEAKLYWVAAGQAPRLLESFMGTTDSGRAPGMAEGLGIGAAARRAATSAALGGGAHAAIEGSRADDLDEARHIGTALGLSLKRFFAEQGWIAASR